MNDTVADYLREYLRSKTPYPCSHVTRGCGYSYFTIRSLQDPPWKNRYSVIVQHGIIQIFVALALAATISLADPEACLKVLKAVRTIDGSNNQ